MAILQQALQRASDALHLLLVIRLEQGCNAISASSNKASSEFGCCNKGIGTLLYAHGVTGARRNKRGAHWSPRVTSHSRRKCTKTETVLQHCRKSSSSCSLLSCSLYCNRAPQSVPRVQKLLCNCLIKTTGLPLKQVSPVVGNLILLYTQLNILSNILPRA